MSFSRELIEVLGTREDLWPAVQGMVNDRLRRMTSLSTVAKSEDGHATRGCISLSSIPSPKELILLF